MTERLRPKEMIHRAGWSLFDFLANRGYSIEVVGGENLRELNDHPELPAFVYFNHLSLDDPALIASLYPYRLGRRKNKVIFPVSEEYVHFKFDKIHALYSSAVKAAEILLGFKMPQVIQAYRLRDDRLTEEKKKALEEKSKKINSDFLSFEEEQIKEGATSNISPEGHRGEGQLQPGEKGLGFIIKKMAQLRGRGKIIGGLVLPVAIVYETDYKRGMNFSLKNPPKVRLIIGSPLSINQTIDGSKQLVNKETINGDDVTHFLMLQLCRLLPESMWGVYHPDLLADTLAGRFELRMNPETRKSGVFDIKNNAFI